VFNPKKNLTVLVPAKAFARTLNDFNVDALREPKGTIKVSGRVSSLDTYASVINV
jgi:hypothetical protein